MDKGLSAKSTERKRRHAESVKVESNSKAKRERGGMEESYTNERVGHGLRGRRKGRRRKGEIKCGGRVGKTPGVFRWTRSCRPNPVIERGGIKKAPESTLEDFREDSSQTCSCPYLCAFLCLDPCDKGLDSGGEE